MAGPFTAKGLAICCSACHGKARASSGQRRRDAGNHGVFAVQWYQVVFELIDMRSFSNLWYWIILAVVWSMASHWVLGVPYDMITRARRMGEGAMIDLEMLTRINTQRLLYIVNLGGLWIFGFLCFLLSGLLVLAIPYRLEFAQAVLFILVPMLIVMAMSIRSAGMIAAGEDTGEALLRRLHRHRLSTQVVGMFAIFVTSLYGMWFNLHINILG